MSKLAMIPKQKLNPASVRRCANFLSSICPRAQANETQELVIWCADDNDPDTFYVFELYSNHEAPQANAQAPWFWDYMKQVQPLLAGQPEIAMATPTWAKGVGL
ncbi:MAG: hypothetical protein U0401_13680 [Anaerolineae bacterium]